MNFVSAKPFIILFKFLIVLSFSFISLSSIHAEENLYDRGKELIEQKDYLNSIKGFDLAAKAGNIDVVTS